MVRKTESRGTASNKLVAFAGIAKTFEARRGDMYIAGTWKSIIKEGLGWYWTLFRHGLTPASQTRSRAPSWSWLSLDGEIGFYLETSGNDSLSYFCSVLQTPEPENAGSSVLTAHGSLRVEGLMLPVGSIEWSGNNISYFQVASFRFEQGPGPDTTHLDFDDSRPEVEGICSQLNPLFVPLCASQSVVVGVIIVKPHGTGNYHRIGGSPDSICKDTPQKSGPSFGWLDSS